MISFSRRSLGLPLPTNSPAATRRLLAVARRLVEGDAAAVAAQVRRGRDDRQWRGGAPSEDGPSLAELREQLFANALVDLVEGEWTLEVDGSALHVVAPTWTAREQKEAVKRSLEARAREQLRASGTRRFIESMEAGGVLDLVADGRAVVAALEERGTAAVEPVLEPARPADGLVDGTELRRHDVFRYLRYTWSFPYESVPGRTLPFLIRDSGQPGAPVCGLLSLASPVPRLEARDAGFCWTPRCFGRVLDVVGVVEDAGCDGAATDLASAIRVASAGMGDAKALGRLTVAAAAAALGARCDDADGLAAEALAWGQRRRVRRARRARRVLVGGLLDEIETTTARTSREGFERELALAQSDVAAASSMLREIAASSREELRRDHRDVGSDPDAGFTDALYRKKRARLLADLLPARAAVAALVERGNNAKTKAALRAWRRELTDACGGGSAGRGVRFALDRRRVRLLSSQVAEVNVCGAIPPYGPLLGGKLAALLALSREVASVYREAYSGPVGEIQRGMAGRSLEATADLVGLSTSSFYPGGSAQYNRLRLPRELGGAGWHEVGRSRGFGSLHFSRATSDLSARLIELTHGRTKSRFGEGPSERLRKLRDALRSIQLPVGELLEHGMQRPSFVALLDPSAVRGGAGARRGYHRTGPSAQRVADYWRRRWLEMRLSSPGVLATVADLGPESVRISRLIPEQED